MSPENWRGAPSQGAQGRMIRQPGPMQGGQIQPQGGRRQLTGPQQMNSENIAYNVEHVFKDEYGKEVRKMPVEINGETIWVECVPGGGQGVQGGEGRQQQPQPDQDGGIMMEIGDSDGLEIHGQGGPKTVPKPPTNTSNTKNLTAEQRNQIIH